MEMNRLLLAIVIGGVLTTGWVACSNNGISGDELSLRKGGVMGVTQAPAPSYTKAEPGEGKMIPRAFHDAPPMISHDITGLKDAPGNNECMDCHEVSDKETPGIPPSHHIKVEMVNKPRSQARNGQVTYFGGFYRVAKVAGNRFDCLLCHVPQAENAALLVENGFQIDQPAKTPKEVLDTLNEKGDF